MVKVSNQPAKPKRDQTKTKRVGRPKKNKSGKASPGKPKKVIKSNEPGKRRRGRPPKNRLTETQILKDEIVSTATLETNSKKYPDNGTGGNSEIFKIKLGQITTEGDGNQQGSKREVNLQPFTAVRDPELIENVESIRERRRRTAVQIKEGIDHSPRIKRNISIASNRPNLINKKTTPNMFTQEDELEEPKPPPQQINPSQITESAFHSQTNNIKIPVESLTPTITDNSNPPQSPNINQPRLQIDENLLMINKIMQHHVHYLKNFIENSALETEKRLERKIDCIGLTVLSLLKKHASTDYRPAIGDIISGAMSYDAVEQFMKLMQTGPNLFRKKRRNSIHPEKDSVSNFSIKGSVSGVATSNLTPGQNNNSSVLSKPKRGRPKTSKNKLKNNFDELVSNKPPKRRESGFDSSYFDNMNPMNFQELQNGDLNLIKMVQSQTLEEMGRNPSLFAQSGKLSEGKRNIVRKDIQSILKRNQTMPETQNNKIEEERNSISFDNINRNKKALNQSLNHFSNSNSWNNIETSNQNQNVRVLSLVNSSNPNKQTFQYSENNNNNTQTQNSKPHNQSFFSMKEDSNVSPNIIPESQDKPISFKDNSNEKNPGKKGKRIKKLRKEKLSRNKITRKKKNLNLTDTFNQTKNQIENDQGILSMGQPQNKLTSEELDQKFKSNKVLSFIQNKNEKKEREKNENVDLSPTFKKQHNPNPKNLNVQKFPSSDINITIPKNYFTKKKVLSQRNIGNNKLLTSQIHDDKEEIQNMLTMSQKIKERSHRRRTNKLNQQNKDTQKTVIKKKLPSKSSLNEINIEVGNDIKNEIIDKKQRQKEILTPHNIFAEEEKPESPPPLKKSRRGRPPKKRNPKQDLPALNKKPEDSKPNNTEGSPLNKISSRFSEEKLTAVKIKLPIGTTPPQSNPVSARIKNISSIDNQMNNFKFGTPNQKGSGNTDESNPKEVLSFNRKGPIIKAGDKSLLAKPKQAVFVFENDEVAPGPTFHNLENHSDLKEKKNSKELDKQDSSKWQVDVVEEIDDVNEGSVDFLSKDELFKKNRPAPIIDEKFHLKNLGRETRPLSEIDSQKEKGEEDLDQDEELDFLDEFGF